MEQVRSLRTRFNQSVRYRWHDAGVKVVCAEAFFREERTVAGGDATVKAPLIVVNILYRLQRLQPKLGEKLTLWIYKQRCY